MKDYHGTISRSFTLPHEIDEAKSKANYTDGVLQLTLPTKAKTNGKRLAVN